METTVQFGQTSWRFASNRVEAFLTEKGGHLAPVTFDLGACKVQPYMVAPWATEKVADDTEEVLKPLRGDFFCMPFGDQFMPDDGYRYPLHGESATRSWTLDGIDREGDRTELRANMTWATRPGRIEKLIRLVEDHTALYCRHTVTGVSGAFSYGLHPTLQLPDEEGSALVSQAPFDFGEVTPYTFEMPEKKGYQALRTGAVFSSLNSVPRMDGSKADLTRYPARKGFDDFVMLRTRQDLSFGWAAVCVPSKGYLWISVKDPRVLPISLMWMSNGGRYYAPWSGRNIGVLGMEEAALDLPLGPADMAMQKLSECPVQSEDEALTVNTIMAVASIPSSFGRVTDLKRMNGGVRAVADNGMHVEIPLDLSFVTRG